MFSPNSASLHAKKTGRHPEETGIKSGNRPQITTNAEENRPICGNPRKSSEISHNSPQMPAIPKDSGRTIEDSSPAIRSAIITF
jgi:hypothetical protein